MKDEIVVFALLLSFALLVTSHIAIVAGLVARRLPLRAPVALVVAPLAPYWAFRVGMRARGAVWMIGAVVYAITRVLATG